LLPSAHHLLADPHRIDHEIAEADLIGLEDVKSLALKEFTGSCFEALV
jgi:hypothetical protein